MNLSELEAVFQVVEVDAAKGFQLVPVQNLDGDQLSVGQSVVIDGIHELSLLERAVSILQKKYPAEHRVAFVRPPHVDWFALNDQPSLQMGSGTTALFVPHLKQDERTKSFQTLQFYLDEITGVGGDVWIKQQTHETLIPYLEEETQELIEAIREGDTRNIVEELGDVLCQVFYQTSYAEFTGEFTLENVLESINLKLRRRHPHVFDGMEANTVEEVDAIWQNIKAKEKELGL